MRIQHQYKMHGHNRDMLGNAHIANANILFMSKFAFQIWIFKSGALKSSGANTDLATGIVAARCLGKKDSPRIILSDNIVRFGPLSMLEAQGTPKSHRNHYGECPRPIPNTSDNQQLADCNTIRYGQRYVFRKHLLKPRPIVTQRATATKSAIAVCSWIIPAEPFFIYEWHIITHRKRGHRPHSQY